MIRDLRELLKRLNWLKVNKDIIIVDEMDNHYSIEEIVEDEKRIYIRVIV